MFTQYLSDKYIQYFIFYYNFDVRYILTSQYLFSGLDKIDLVKILNLNFNINQPIDELIFNNKQDMYKSIQNLRELYLGERFNQTIDYLPQSLKILILEDNFNQSVNHLPKNLKIIKFGRKFDQPVNYLPQSLKELKTGLYFNQNIDYLPQNLEKLILNSLFKQPINRLPQNLKVLVFKSSTTLNMNIIPKSLEILYLSSHTPEYYFRGIPIWFNVKMITEYKDIN